MVEIGKGSFSQYVLCRPLIDTLSDYRDTIVDIFGKNYLIPILDTSKKFYLITDRYFTKLLSDIAILIRYFGFIKNQWGCSNSSMHIGLWLFKGIPACQTYSIIASAMIKQNYDSGQSFSDSF